jgi:hypothetical protein
MEELPDSAPEENQNRCNQGNSFGDSPFIPRLPQLRADRNVSRD